MTQHSKHTVYIGSSRVIFTSETPDSSCSIIEVDASLRVSRAKIVKKVETDKFVVILTPNPNTTFRSFMEQFVYVEAAGGIVQSVESERLLMIRLRGRWDLPKGHVESGESSHAAALREVEEETGVRAELVSDTPFAETWHAYNTYGRWELKRTVWWIMSAHESGTVPQFEEGITEVVWCDRVMVAECVEETYETIKGLIGALVDR